MATVLQTIFGRLQGGRRSDGGGSGPEGMWQLQKNAADEGERKRVGAWSKDFKTTMKAETASCSRGQRQRVRKICHHFAGLAQRQQPGVKALFFGEGFWFVFKTQQVICRNF
jgi:hypothetical protein